MLDYSNNTTIEVALQEYFSRYNLGDGGYTNKTYDLSVFGLFSIPVPNTKGHVAAVKLHDIHHILTNIDANLPGESEIGAWEIASGCGTYYIAWILNLGSFSYGIFLWPSRVMKAFMSGCDSKNLYHGTPYDAKLLSQTVGELRTQLHISNEVHYSTMRFIRFGFFAIVSLLPVLIVVGVGIAFLY